MSAESRSRSQASSDEWQTATEESPSRVVFDTPGDVFIGAYVGTNEIDNDGDPFTQYLFRDDNGELMAVNESFKIKEGMAKVPEGSLTRIEYVKDVPVGKGNAMKDFRIQFKS